MRFSDENDEDGASHVLLIYVKTSVSQPIVDICRMPGLGRLYFAFSFSFFF